MRSAILESVGVLWSLCRKFGGDCWNLRMIRRHKVRYLRDISWPLEQLELVMGVPNPS